MNNKILRLPSFAKVNLFLHVLGKRENGYHDIETIFQQVSLYDDIILTRREKGIELTCNHANVPTDDRNLCIRAALSLQRYCEKEYGCSIDLRKRVPVAAGLGGGSSNAAVTLLGLNLLWDLGLTKSELLKLASELGSDVPFFIEGGQALGLGRGEEIYPIENKSDLFFVIIHPPIPISSRWAYKSSNFSLTKRKKNSKFKGLRKYQMHPESYFADTRNDLEPFVFRSYPELERIKIELEKQGAIFARLSGSGPCVFGLYNFLRETKDVTREFSSRFNSFAVKSAKWGYDEAKCNVGSKL